MKKKCKNCEHNCEGDYCFRCKPRSPLPKISKKKKEELVDVIEETSKMVKFFMSIWWKKQPVSEVSGTFLGNEPLSIFFHHILPKEKYPEAEYDEENIIMLTFEEHQDIEADMYKYEEINKRRQQLKIKYKL